MVEPTSATVHHCDWRQLLGKSRGGGLAHHRHAVLGRLTGDGPAQWANWVVVARPRTEYFARWGTLPGGYVLPKGQGGPLPIPGGKPLWLMQRLVEDYSRPGELVCDPCCGAGTTLVASLLSGRRAIGGDISEEHAALARLWCENPTRPGPTLEARPQDAEQPRLLGVE